MIILSNNEYFVSNISFSCGKKKPLQGKGFHKKHMDTSRA